MAEIETEQALVNANRELIRRMEAKVKAARLSLVELHQSTFVEAWDEFFNA